MSKKLPSVKKLAAAAGIAAGLAVLAPSAASAGDTGFQQLTLSPGQTKCVKAVFPAYSVARGEAFLVSGHNSRFTFGTYSPNRVLVDSGSPASSFAAEVNSFTHLNAFPGYFQVCAVNQSQKVSTVAMRVFGY